MSYRINLNDGNGFDGRNRFILNAYSSYRQKAAWDVFRSVGLPASAAAVVRLVTPEIDDTATSMFKSSTTHSSKTASAIRAEICSAAIAADRRCRLRVPRPEVDPYLDVYRRENKKGDRDLTKLLALLQALSSNDDDVYVERTMELADVAEWALYFAANNVLGNVEGGLSYDAPG